MSFEDLKTRQRESIIMKLELKTLQDMGGQASRSDLRERILDTNEEIADFAEQSKVSKKTGAEWYPFRYNFNFALKNLQIAGFLTYSRTNPDIVLSEKGINTNIETFDAERDVYSVSMKYWNERRKDSVEKHEGEEDAEADKADDYNEAFKTKLLGYIGKMTPRKFETFSRALLNKMGVEFTEIGTQISNDGGIDGYGYCRTDDFRTSRVVIQCKRWQGNVGSSEINQFLGAMNKFQADYGIFITNSRYTTSAREAARAGTPITLIDGDELVRLVKKYNLYVYPITVYEFTEFYDAEESA
ncbi:restriction endonuclease [Candidatus Saccharibacteria bacterium]|nr:restriction endonuclease [Candidatus Saccharibacteria bacterium]